ncbi:hypothetical protein [Bacillus infantis]|uniref:Uncharacterized protein n=1 Tax=Bacillus infantis TaxID=324767 RepID=A0A5D4SWH6_9BACI|nr:hypothetical protein FZD47_03875 [Bacillus infantis]
MMGKSFHACATCIHFQAERAGGKMEYRCRRLGFDTLPYYQFNCWDPKENVRKLMEKREGGKENEMRERTE